MKQVGPKYLNNSWKILAFNFFILGLIMIIFSYIADTEDWFFHTIFVVLSSLIIFKKFSKLLNLPKEILFTDLRWIFLFSFWFYFVFGSSLLVYGSDELISNTKNIYSVDLKTALMVNSINSIGLSIVLLIASIINISWPTSIIVRLKREIKYFDPMGHRTLIVATLFCFTSFVYCFLESIEYVEKFFLFGIFQIFQHAGIGFGLIFFYYKGRYRMFICFIVAVYLFLYTVSGIYFSNKSLVAAPIVFLVTIFFIKRGSLKLLAITFVGFYFLIQIIGGYASYNRSYNNDFNFTNNLNLNNSKLNFSLWDRLNYMSSQAAAVDFYNKGDNGDSLKNVFWLFIPRFLNKDKPDVSKSGTSFANKFRENSGSRDSPGVIIEGYYNFGWIGLILLSSIIGLIIKIYSILIKEIINNKIYAFYFLIFSGLWTCFRIDGLFITDYLGQLVLFLYFIIFLNIVLVFLRGLTN